MKKARATPTAASAMMTTITPPAMAPALPPPVLPSGLPGGGAVVGGPNTQYSTGQSVKMSDCTTMVLVHIPIIISTGSDSS